MKIVAISDTHNKHRQLTIPEADVLVCSGDISFRGELNIMKDFADWLKTIPITTKIVVFGNHETGMQYGSKRQPAIQMMQDAGAHYLENSGVEIDGLHFWGSPATPWFHNWEWNYQRGKDIATVWKQIPNQTNILITHGPRMGVLDEAPRGFGQTEHVGCQDLGEKIDQLPNLKAHIFGHIHNGYGTTTIGQVQYINAANCDEKYQAVNSPIVIEV